MRVTYLRNIPIKENERKNLNIRVEEYYREKERDVIQCVSQESLES